MKKMILAMAALLMLASLASCAGDKTKNPDDSSETQTMIFGDGGGDGTSGFYNETEKMEPIRESIDYYGMLEEQYSVYYEDISIIPGTFTADGEVYALLDTLEGEGGGSAEESATRAPTIFYIAEELDIGEGQLKAYYKACVDGGIFGFMPSDKALAAIASGDREKTMELCAHPSALYSGGKVYTLKMLLSGEAADVGDGDITETLNRAVAYYGDELLQSPLLTKEMSAKLAQLGFIKVGDSENGCGMHLVEYHTIPEELMEFCTPEEYETWKAELSFSSHSIPENIYDFVRKFNVSREKFIEIYNAAGGTLGLYNIDVIYGDGAENASDYYSQSSLALKEDIERDRVIAKLKEGLAEVCNMGDFVTNVHEFSLAELLLMTSRDDAVLDYLDDAVKESGVSLEIDFAGIYDNASELMRMIRGRTPYSIDRYVSGRLMVDTPYEAQKTVR